MEEEEQPPMEPMHVPSTIKFAKMFIPTEDLVCKLGYTLLWVICLKQDKNFFGASSRRPNGR